MKKLEFQVKSKERFKETDKEPIRKGDYKLKLKEIKKQSSRCK